MADKPPLDEDEDVRIYDGLAEWDLLRRLGPEPSVELLCPDAPEIWDRLRREIEAQKRLEVRLGLNGDRQAEPDTTGPVVPSHIPGIVIDGEIGRGAMGVVYRGTQTALSRPVAVKAILGGALASTERRGRFRTEAVATARIPHPNIVAVYDTGEMAGLPYLVLEYLPGGTLADRLRGEPQAPRRSAELARALSGAVVAAHAHGVLHRDLKPRNIIFADDGTPKIADYGLAKLLDQDQGHTVAGQSPGTPSYMAPEQAGARQYPVGPATDIYSLGAILYELLTGRPPFRGETALDTLELARTQDPMPPRRLQPKVPRDLETICLKCLEKNPARRYSSAEALADDLGRFLDGRPVVARRVSPLGHAWRWCGRRPDLAASLACLVLVILGAFLGLTYLWSMARDERDRAGENFRLARRVVDDSFTAISENRLLREPGMQPLRKELLERALEYYREFLRRTGDDRALRAELAEARLRVGQITQQIGSKREALGHYEAARSLYGALVAADPDATGYRAGLARAHAGSGKLLVEAGRPAEAERMYREALAHWQRLVEAHPDAIGYREQLGATLNDFVGARWKLGGREAAGPALEDAGRFWRRLVEAHPEVVGYRVGWAQYQLGIGLLLRGLGDPAGSEHAFLQAVERWDELIAGDPEDSTSLHFKAWSHYNLGALQRETGNVEGARQNLEIAQSLWEPIVQGNPRVSEYRDGLARCLSHLGLLRRDSGDPEAALPFYREVVEHRREIARHQPDWGANTLMLGLASCTSGQVHHELGRPDEAKACFDEAIGLFDEALMLNPGDPPILQEQIHLLANCAETRSRNPARAVELGQRFVELHPQSGMSWSSLALARYRVGEWEGAIEALRTAMDLQNGGAAYEWFLMALSWKQQGRTEEARSWYVRAVDWMERNRPNDVLLRRLLAEAADLLEEASGPGKGTTG